MIFDINVEEILADTEIRKPLRKLLAQIRAVKNVYTLKAERECNEIIKNNSLIAAKHIKALIKEYKEANHV